MSLRYRRNRGIALIVVLFLTAILTTLMYAFLREMQVEYHLANACGQERQARQLAMSAIDKAIATLAAETTPVASPASAWYDNADEWYEMELGDGVFSMVRMTHEADGRVRFGIADEGSRINLNVAPREVLLKLPKATQEIADSIVDWRDPDESAQAQGAENAYYQALATPYKCKNGPFDTVEEMLLVRGMTPEILYGEDWNQNGILDANENDGDKSPPADNSDGVLDLGFIAYLTVHSYDRNVRNEGTPRVNVNTATDEQLQQALGDVLIPQQIQQIVARRAAFGPGGYPTIAHVMPIPVSPEMWKQIADRLTTSAAATLPGLLNINTAPRKVLEMLPSLTADDVGKLVTYRTQQGADLSTVGWLVDVLALDKLQAIAGFITTRAWQYRFDAVARIGPKSDRAATATSVKTLDASAPPPTARVMRRILAIYDRAARRLVYVRDVSRLGMPYPVEEPE
jgi:type II secretory pathway component PulK